jgi:hypothetical protein
VVWPYISIAFIVVPGFMQVSGQALALGMMSFMI